MIPVLKFDKRDKKHLLVISGRKPLSILLDKGVSNTTILRTYAKAKRIRAISLQTDDTLPYVKFKNIQQEYDMYSIENDVSDLIITPYSVTKNKTGSEQEKDIYISELASSCHAQILVTSNKRLLSKRVSGESSPINYLTAEQTVAYIGFLDRKNGNYNIPDVHDMTANRDWIFWRISYDLLSEDMYRLVQALSQTQEGSSIALRTVSRVSDILKSRDYIHQQILSHQLGENSDDMLYYLDHYLVATIAAFDTLARIIDRVYRPLTNAGNRFSTSNISWTSGWVRSNSVSTLPPTTAFNRHSNLHDLINKLRNYIHAEGLQKPVLSFKDGNTENPKFYIPKDEIDCVDNIMKSLDSSNEWIKYSPNDKVSAFDLADFTERTTRLIIIALHDIVASIEINQIDNIDLSKIKDDFSGNWPSRTSLDTARLLFGLNIEQT